MKKIFLFILCIISPYCPAETVRLSSPNKTESINYTCTDSTCSAWVESSTEKISLFKDVPTSTVSAKWHSSNLASASFSCGSPCNVSFFYQKENGVSKPIHNVLALDTQRNCVLKPTSDGKGIAIAAIFYKDGEKYYWHAKYNDPKFSFYTQSAVMFSTIKGNFLSNGKLEINYLNNKGKNRKLLINQKCQD